LTHETARLPKDVNMPNMQEFFSSPVSKKLHLNLCLIHEFEECKEAQPEPAQRLLAVQLAGWDGKSVFPSERVAEGKIINHA
jgi:hypothetical protein